MGVRWEVGALSVSWVCSGVEETRCAKQRGAVPAACSAFLLSASALGNHCGALGAAGEGRRAEVEVTVR